MPIPENQLNKNKDKKIAKAQNLFNSTVKESTYKPFSVKTPKTKSSNVIKKDTKANA